MSQTINEILNLNISHSTPTPVPTPSPSSGGGASILAPNTGGGFGEVINQLGAFGCGLVTVTICVFVAAVIIFCLRRQFIAYRSAALLSSLGLFAFACGLAIPSVVSTTEAIKVANDDHVTDFNVTVGTEPVATTVNTEFTLTEAADRGYTVYAFMEGDNTLYSADGSAKIIATTEPSADPATLTPNSYGVKDLTTGVYGALSTDPTNPTTLYHTDEATPAGSTITLTYATNLESDITDNTYTGHIVYVVTPVPPNPTFGGITTMQEMTAEICNNETTPNAGATELTKFHTEDPSFVPAATLTDVRDDKTYDIVKLADGHCWMRENLKLGGEADITLNSGTSNVAEDFTLPASAKWGADSADAAHMYTENNEYYYNWYTATAGSRASSAGAGEASASVCPKGWVLPSDTSNVVNTDYYKIFEPYMPSEAWTWALNGGWSTRTTAYINPPLSLSFAGQYNNGTGQVINKDVNANFWSSTASAGDTAYGLIAYKGVGVYPQTTNSKVFGSSVRCIAEH